ncbi:MAG: cache domain-containing protein, partial [Caldimonas sp.]
MPMRPVPLRRRLLLLAAVAILPLALMSGVALQALLEQQRRQAEQSTLDLARALATAVDTELRLTISALQSLALTDSFGNSGEADLARAHASARRALATRPEWRAVLLATPAGAPVFGTATEFGETPQPITEPETIAEVVRTNAPVIGALTRGPRGNVGVPVRVPVERDGTLRYVLTAIVRPEAILRVVSAQRIPEDWTVSVFDSRGARVARSREHERFLGTPPSPSLAALIA